MPIAGKGMLLTSMNIDAANEPNSTAGTTANISKNASRCQASSKRGAMSRMTATRNISPLFHRNIRGPGQSVLPHALANQTAWSKANIARFKDMIRGVVAHHHQPRHRPRCCPRHHPAAAVAGAADKLRSALRDQLDPSKLDGIISMHLLENDPALSKPITDDPSAPNPGAGDWFVLIDATDVGAVPAAAARSRTMPRSSRWWYRTASTG